MRQAGFPLALLKEKQRCIPGANHFLRENRGFAIFSPTEQTHFNNQGEIQIACRKQPMRRLLTEGPVGCHGSMHVCPRQTVREKTCRVLRIKFPIVDDASNLRLLVTHANEKKSALQ